MPKEAFVATSSEEDVPYIDIQWGRGTTVVINGADVEREMINRIIKTLRKARDQAYPHWLADYRPVPEEAFWSPGEDAIMLNGETYVRANPESDRALLAQWRESMLQWQQAVRDWEKHTAELEEGRRRPFHIKPITPTYLYDF